QRGVFGERDGKDPGIRAVGVVHQNPLLPDKDHSAFALERDVIGQLIGTRRIETAVVPIELDRRLGTPRPELVMHRCRDRIRYRLVVAARFAASGSSVWIGWYSHRAPLRRCRFD